MRNTFRNWVYAFIVSWCYFLWLYGPIVITVTMGFVMFASVLAIGMSLEDMITEGEVKRVAE